MSTGDAKLRVALGEYDTAWHDPATSLERAAQVVERAASAGAQLVALPETCTTGFTMETAQWAQASDGRSVQRVCTIARNNGVWVLAGIALREESESRAYNTAVLCNPSGDVAGRYRKQRLFAYAGEDESYATGSSPFVATIEGVRLGIFICFDLRFPELFRAVARDVDAIVIIANWPKSRRSHWDVLLRARAIEDQCYVIGVNRTGSGGGLEYDGGSAAYDPWGEPIGGGGAVVTIETERVKSVRSKFPFLPND